MSIAVLLATYNGEKYLGHLLDSLINQKFQDFIVYISDDNSSDGTLNVINYYIKKYPQKFVLLPIHESKKSARSNFLYLLENVDSDLYFFCDQDDVWKNNHISLLKDKYDALSELEKQQPVVIHADLEVVDEQLNVISKSFFTYNNIAKYPENRYFYCVHNNVTGCAMLLNRALKKLLYMDINVLRNNIVQLPMHDYLCAFIANIFGRIYFVDESIVLYRQHANNSVGAKNAKSFSYLKSKLFNLKQQVEYYNESVRFITFFCNYYEKMLDKNDYNLLTEFCSLRKHWKLYRIGFILKNKFTRDTIIRKLIQIFTI